ncbi:MAG TPA: carboxypeptidase regulatory-like domain-containing protein [Ilumatobacter sp.]|nr:carboxypeptidase regulatory-like domain-containing protein [Ilumatobacter sp.]
MRTVAFPDTVDVVPGDSGMISVSITNTTSVIDAYRVQVFGLDPEWVTVTPPRLSLFPGQTERVEIQVRLPDDYPASQRTLAVNVSSDDDPGAFSLSQVALAVQPRTRTSVRLDPVMVTAGRRARFGMVVSNDGNAAVQVDGYAVDPEALAHFRFDPPSVLVAPGRDQVIDVSVSGGRAWFGQPRARTMTFGVITEQPGALVAGGPESRVETLGTFLQRPRISRWLISLLGLLTAAAVFAAVLSRTFNQVVEQARVSDAVIDAALERDAAGGAMVPTNPGTIVGSVVSASTNQGMSGVQAELFVADDIENPVGSAATDDQGAFTFANLGAGEYLVRFSGAGVDSTWNGGVSAPGDAEPVVVELGQPTELDALTIVGTPVDVTGVIAVDDPAGTTVSLVVPGQAGAGAVVATAVLAPDGSFTLPDVPSPGNYQLIVEKPGSPPVVRDFVLEPGQNTPDVEVAVPSGQGIISGSVSGPFGALGGATITASNGSLEVTTVSLTQGQVGTYALRNLATPGQYTVVVSRDGYASESRTISLTNEQQAGAFDARLVPAVGSIRGRVTVDGQPARGLTVTVNGGNISRTVGVVSQGGSAGSYAITGLDAPGTYTLTFAGAGTIPQVRVIDLDPASGRENETGVDVALSREATSVTGIVRGPDGSPLGQATVTLSDGTQTRTMPSADDPVGRFAFSNVRPGAYTLSASRTGTEPVTVLVNITASTPVAAIELQLGQQASLTGSVNGFDPADRTVTVRLFTPEQFPQGEALATVTTDADGNYRFPGLEAPANYVVAVYAGATAADPLDSRTVVAEPGRPVTVPTITVTLP